LPLSILLCLCSVLSALAAQVPQFEESEMSSAEGYAMIRWDHPDESLDAEFQLVVLGPDSLRMTYETPAQSIFLSGLSNGDYELRVRYRSDSSDEWEQWSQPMTLQVAHHPLRLAFALFVAGAIMFLSIVIFLLRHANDAVEVENGVA